MTQRSLTLTGLAQSGLKLRTCPLSKLRLAAARVPQTGDPATTNEAQNGSSGLRMYVVGRKGFFLSHGYPTESYISVDCDVPKGGGGGGMQWRI